MCGQKGQRQGEGGGWEDGERFCEDVGCCFGLKEVGVELVAVNILSFRQYIKFRTKIIRFMPSQLNEQVHQLELI